MGGHVPPAVFVPSARGIPVPVELHSTHNPDDDHLRAAHPQAHGLPVLSDGAVFVSEQLGTQYYVCTHSPTNTWAPNHHRHRLHVPCCTSKRLRAPQAVSHRGRRTPGQPRPKRVGHLRPSDRPNDQPANRWPAEPSPSPHHPPSFISHFRGVFRPELCTTDQPSLSQSVLEPSLFIREDSGASARGLIRSRL